MPKQNLYAEEAIHQCSLMETLMETAETQAWTEQHFKIALIKAIISITDELNQLQDKLDNILGTLKGEK